MVTCVVVCHLRDKKKPTKTPKYKTAQNVSIIIDAVRCVYTPLTNAKTSPKPKPLEVTQGSLLSHEHLRKCSRGGNGGTIGPGAQREVAVLRDEACTDLDGCRDVPVQHVAV